MPPVVPFPQGQTMEKPLLMISRHFADVFVMLLYVKPFLAWEFPLRSGGSFSTHGMPHIECKERGFALMMRLLEAIWTPCAASPRVGVFVPLMSRFSTPEDLLWPPCLLDLLRISLEPLLL